VYSQPMFMFEPCISLISLCGASETTWDVKGWIAIDSHGRECMYSVCSKSCLYCSLNKSIHIGHDEACLPLCTEARW
jgi:hypothetical protein